MHTFMACITAFLLDAWISTFYLSNEVNHIKFPGYACLNADCHDYHLLEGGKCVFVGCQTSMLFKEDRCSKSYIGRKNCSILILGRLVSIVQTQNECS